MDVVVVGGGLAGLTAAATIHQAGMSVQVIEARPFVGGRAMTVVPEGLGEHAWFDVGATWHWDDQPRVQALAAELGLHAFPQYREGLLVSEEWPDGAPQKVDLPPPVPAEYRFVGGAQRLCDRLAARLPDGSVTLNSNVVAIDEGMTSLGVSVIGEDGTATDLYPAYVVMAVPPRLVFQDIAFTPALSDEMSHVLRHTPTWMATALKAVAVYESPFWRDEGLAGAAMSEAGPFREIHDACTDDASAAGLWGFISPRHEFRDLSFDDRLEQVFAQLGRLFGPVASDPLRYFERDWSGDPYTNDEVFWVPDQLLDFGHPAFAEALYDGRLVWAGTETSAEGGGHMEGAIASGHRAAELVLSSRWRL